MTTTKDLEIYGYKGADDIAGGAGNDILDGGEEDQINKYGRDVFIDDDTSHTVENSMGVVIDRVFYVDDPSGIVADFETGIVVDGYGSSTDTVLNFERAFGSFHDDVVTLSNSLYRGYNPMYGNDTIYAPSSQWRRCL